ncbi:MULTISPECIES: nucleotidyltransferase family protein [unclassified Alteromonas]|uniref:nucleotidyltransferase family protein n=1 Tax=unclassified Alteromonas TaxID=2614992 RepID=UPI0005094DDC|nr:MULTISPECIES: nucleotidyltransferase family protein [unclassified Alteromonas]
MLSRSVFISVYCRLEGIEYLNEVQWNALIRILRQKSLIASYYHRLCLRDLDGLIPGYCKNVFISAIRFADAQAHQTSVQAEKLTALLGRHDIPFIFLKGAAYTLGKNANGVGRLMTDIDICVTREIIDKLEVVLLDKGWTFKEMDEHDDKYYRAWSHELPPLTNDEDGVVLDVHHTLVPPVKGRFLDIEKLVASSVDNAKFSVPSKEWLVLHSALHLIINEDVDNGLRDLTDIYRLLSDEADAKAAMDRTSTLFKQEGFYNEWLTLARLLKFYFALDILDDADKKLPLYYRIRAIALTRSLLPRSSFITNKYSAFWSLLNYLLGYESKMPFHILVRQALFKVYRNAAKFIFGEFFFRKAKKLKEN